MQGDMRLVQLSSHYLRPMTCACKLTPRNNCVGAKNQRLGITMVWTPCHDLMLNEDQVEDHNMDHIHGHLNSNSVLVTTSKAPVTTSVALVSTSFLLLLVRHLLLLAMHLFLVAWHLFLIAF